MSSSAEKPKRSSSRASSAHQDQDDVITLLDSDDSDHEISPATSTSRKTKSASKSTNDIGRTSSSFVPFHLYETTSSTSKFQTNDAAKKYFRSLREIIGLETSKKKKRSTSRKFQWMVIFNYCIDFAYLLEKLMPEILEFHRVVIFYGAGAGPEAMDQWKQLLAGSGNTVEFIQLVPSDPPRSRLNPLPIKIPYGVHHTKMFLMGYEEDDRSMCRVVVHTANLLLGDIEHKTQGAYSQDFPLKQSNDKGDCSKDQSKNKGGKVPVANPYKRKRNESNTKSNASEDSGWPFEDEDVPFEEDLITYLESYQYVSRQTWCTSSSSKLSNKQKMSWLQLIRQYDYSSAYAVLIPSVPGRHKDDSYHNFGYLKLRKAIVENVSSHQQNSKQSAMPPPPILCQFSSIGSLNEKWLNQFLSSINYTTAPDFDPINNSQNNGRKGANKDNKPLPLSSRMKIIWPTVDEIRTSIEGYRGGGSVPGTVKNLSKEFLQPLFHGWSQRQGNDPLKTACHIPHIKTFLQPSISSTNAIEWITLTSHNLSIAAWGQLQTPSNQSRAGEKVLFIRHWELGVFISPATLAKMAPEEAGTDICMVSFPGISAGDGNAVINIDSDSDDEDETPKVIVPLPFDIDPERYSSNDVPWACDQSCSVPDAFGCIIP